MKSNRNFLAALLFLLLLPFSAAWAQDDLLQALEQQEPEQGYYTLAIGFDIETGGHVFQLHFTNARAMHEQGFISQTTGNFSEGDIHFGFNISRVFQW